MKLIIDKFIMKENDNTNGIRVLAVILGRISDNIGRFRSPVGWTCYSVFRFAFIYYRSTR